MVFRTCKHAGKKMHDSYSRKRGVTALARCFVMQRGLVSHRRDGAHVSQRGIDCQTLHTLHKVDTQGTEKTTDW